jgi:uncharacterized Zn finger protein (UPF0148 family)
MADSFNCPKCGAPVIYNSAEQGNLDMITCPYCGESIVIPAEMRPKPPAPQPRVVDEDSRKLFDEISQEEKDYQASTVKRAKRDKIANYVGLGIGAIAVIAFVIVPIIIALVGGIAGAAALKVSSSSTSTAAANIMATSAVQNKLITDQSNWPVVIHDGFTNNKLNWTTGTDNNDLALEQRTISNGEYIWQFTSKNNVCSFSFPDMSIQKDVFISVDMQMSTTSHSTDDKAGIIFRHSEAKNAFYFFAASSNGGFTLSMYDGSGWNNLVSSDSTVIKPNQVNHLAVSMVGSQIILQINNQVVGSYQDDRLQSGDAGLGFNLSDAGIDGKATFTNFYVRTP